MRTFLFVLLISGLHPLLLIAQPKVVKFNAIDVLLHHQTDTLVMLNFWASWCKPCVKELPLFEELNKKYAEKKFKLVLVSLDFKREFESRVKPLVAENKISSEVFLLDEPDYNSWINKVDTTWSGAIPATMVIGGGKKIFFEREFNSVDELENIINPLIKK